jgi:polyisoprenoid-binding protein YceI
MAGASCRREQKPPVRTEPWLAPALSGSAAAPARATYAVTRGKATIDTRVAKQRVRAEVTRFDGSLDIDFEKPELTRGRLRADLRSVTLEGEDSAALTAELFERLDLHDGDDEHRYAELVITAIDPNPPGAPGRGIAAQGDLTLHGFRVPVVLELTVERGAPDAGSSASLRVRTRRPLLIPLMAYGLLPEAGSEAASGERRGSGLDAAISAEIEAEPAASAPRP